ncbi:MAG: IS21 family transposase, partial [Burkholderiaceae bacterium]
MILAKLKEELSAQRIWQDLTESGATVGYDSVRRFVQRLGRKRSLPFRRMECGPGEEAQVDFGSG